MSYKIVKNKEYLHKKTEPVSSVEEGNEIARKLIEAFNSLSNGLGLSANQIGILKSVSIVKVKKDKDQL
jgi:peptide deformylase